ncbi:glycosyltransferase [Carboxylicivirga sediminis]|uniref:Glycosyltransferase n=1 Tax=Carboxylicivirga sediminis TaxID=2006564 RepID=A0A941IXN7_9BACT|nr:glycosyltransferase [Carboxylicivirga sediminis]MBR8535738.1 glycosyltransferase [Carboxylicivirga sediminis]
MDQSLKEPSISIIIPVKNGIATIRQCLDAIYSQTLIKSSEVIIIDSGSTDGTLDIISQYPVRLVQIPPEDFNHGTTRNYGVSLAKGDYIMMTVQDAIASDDYWLETMHSHFSDDNVAGVCGMQMIQKLQSINPFEWTRTVNPPRIRAYQFKNISNYNALSANKKREICGWDNVNSMYRKSVLTSYPFEPVKFGEDIRWAISILKEGYKIIYDPHAKVAHYHPFDKNSEFHRKYIEIAQDDILLELKSKRVPLLRSFVMLLYKAYKWRINPKWMFTQIHRWLIYNQAHKQYIIAKRNHSKHEIIKQLFI